MRKTRLRARSVLVLLALGVPAGLPCQVTQQGLPTARPEDVGISSAALARIAPAMQAYVDSGKLAGMVAVVARHGKVVYSQAFGKMDVASDTPMRTDAVFRIYSMTKPITAVAILKLVDQHKLRLDDPVSKFIPAFANVKVYDGGPASSPTLGAPARAPTIADLLTHTSGLTYGYFGETPVDSMYRRANLLDGSRTVQQFADSIARMPLLFSPGTRWNYSMATDVLGRVVEVASGKSFDKYLADEIFIPLRMRETTFHWRSEMAGRLPVMYTRRANGALRADTPLVGAVYQPNSRLLSGGGGLLSTTADYLRFAQMLLNEGELDGVRVLKRETVALMSRNQLPGSLTPIPASTGHPGYGHGFGLSVLVDSVASGLAGRPGIMRWWGYAGTFFWIDPKTDLIGMVWTQFIPGRQYPMEQAFQRIVYSAITR